MFRRGVLSRLRRGSAFFCRAVAAVVVALAVGGLPGLALAQDSGATIPAIGFNVSDYATAALTLFGAGLAVLVGIFFAVLIVRLLMRWGGHALGGR